MFWITQQEQLKSFLSWYGRILSTVLGLLREMLNRVSITKTISVFPSVNIGLSVKFIPSFALKGYDYFNIWNGWLCPSLKLLGWLKKFVDKHMISYLTTIWVVRWMNMHCGMIRREDHWELQQKDKVQLLNFLLFLC